MPNNQKTIFNSDKYRRKAEALLKTKVMSMAMPLSEDGILKLRHELEIALIEIDMQHGELTNTDLKKNLRNNEAVFNQFLENSPIYIFFKDENIRSINLSRNYEKLLGKPLHELLGKTMDELFPSDLAKQMVKDDLDVLKNGKKVTIEEEFNGRYYSTIKFPIHIPGKPGMLAGFTMDITESKIAQNLLIKSEEKYRKLHQSLHDGFVYVTMEGKIVESNKAYQDMLGYAPAELETLTYFDITPQKWHGMENKIVEDHILPKGFSPVYEKEYCKKDGTTFPVELRTFLIKDDENKPQGMWAIVRDITERKLSESLLRESEKRSGAMLSAIPDLLFRINLQGIFLDYKADKEDLYIQSWPSLIGKSYKGNMPPEFEELLDLKIKTTLETGKLQTFDYQLEIPGKGYRFYEARMVPCAHDEVIAIARDITERNRVIQALRTSEEKFKSIVESSPSAMYFYRLEQEDRLVLTGSNPASDQIIGIPHQTLIGKTLEEAFPNLLQTDFPEMYKNVARGIINHQAFEIEYGDDRFSGAYSVNVYKTGSNTIAVEFTDISKRKEAEEKLQQNEARLTELNATKDKFFSIMAHDLKSPFTAIVGFSNLMIYQIRNKHFEDAIDYAENILQSSERVMELLNNIQEWSRAQTGRLKFNPGNIDLSALIDGIIQLLKDNALQKSISIKSEISLSEPIFADISMINTVLRNLISNAIKFTNQGGEVIISAKDKQESVVVTVSDNGVGIPAESINKLFLIDQNYSTPGTDNEKGTGLGLILCREFIEKHGGKIWVESEEGKGSRFYFTLQQKR